MVALWWLHSSHQVGWNCTSQELLKGLEYKSLVVWIEHKEPVPDYTIYYKMIWRQSTKLENF